MGVLCAADNCMAMVLAQMETFAPVMHIVEFDALADVIARNNAVPQGLASCPWTRDVRSRRPPEREAVAGPCGVGLWDCECVCMARDDRCHAEKDIRGSRGLNLF